MNVLLLSPEFIPIKGGIGRYLHEIVNHMEKDVNLHILTTPPENKNESEDVNLSDKLNIHYIGKSFTGFFDYFKFQMRCIQQVPKIVRDHNIDLIHSQSSLPDLFLSSKLNIPVVTTVHTTIMGEIKHTISSSTDLRDLSKSEKMMISAGPILTLLEKYYYSRKKRYYITVSKWMKNKLLNDFKNINDIDVRVIYNGANTEKFHPSKKIDQEKIFPQLSEITCPKILYLSRWSERKGIQFLKEAIPKILRKTNVHFIFAGPNQDNINIPSKNCTFLGYIDEKKIPTLFALSDIFILPSLYENFPISMLEAMASGTVVIGTKVGGVPEMIKHNDTGILINPKSSNEIVKSITYLSENEAVRNSLSDNARSAVKKQFNWKQIALETKHYYEMILQNENG